MDAAIRAALELAEQQLVALELGDVDAFLAGVEAHESACAALVSVIPGDLDHEGLLLLEQLVATNQLVSAELDVAMGDVATRLASMNRGHGATGAYLATWQGGLAGVREA